MCYIEDKLNKASRTPAAEVNGLLSCPPSEAAIQPPSAPLFGFRSSSRLVWGNCLSKTDRCELQPVVAWHLQRRERERTGYEPIALHAPIQSTCSNSRRKVGGLFDLPFDLRYSPRRVTPPTDKPLPPPATLPGDHSCLLWASCPVLIYI